MVCILPAPASSECGVDFEPAGAVSWGMSFLAPLFLLAGIAVALPVIFHLMRRSAQREIPFSSLRFLSETPPPMESRRRLEDWPLLLLRLLVFTLLVLAFARPFRLQQQPAASPTSRLDKRIILLDTSASMRREGLWEAAMAAVRGAAGDSGPGVRVALATFNDRLELVAPFQSGFATLGGELAKLAPGWGGTRLDLAIIRAVELLEEEKRRGHEGAGEVLVVTDLQRGSGLDGLAQREWPADIHIALSPLLDHSPPNSGLALVSGGGDPLSPDGGAAARLKLSSSQDVRSEKFRLDSTLTNLHQRELFVPPGRSLIVAAEIPPGQAGPHTVRLLDDGEEFDNTIYLASPTVSPMGVEFIGPDEPENPNLPLYYLRKLFGSATNSMGRFQLWVAGGAAPTGVQADLLVVHSPRGQSDLETVRGALRRGKTVLWLASDPSARAAATSFISPGGLSWESPADSRFHLIGRVDFAHPLFAPFAASSFNDFSKIHFWKRHLPTGSALEKGHVLASFDDGAPLLVEIAIEGGLLYLLTAGWTPPESQLALSSKFAPLLLGMLEQRRGAGLGRSQVRVNDTLPWPDRERENLRVLRPDGTGVEWLQGTEFQEVTMPGPYQVEGRPELAFAANLSPREGETDLLDAPMLAQLGLPLPGRGAPRTQDGRVALPPIAGPSEAESHQRLWKWLLAAAALLILVETLWAIRASPSNLASAAS